MTKQTEIPVYFGNHEKDFYKWILAKAKEASLTNGAYIRNIIKQKYNAEKSAQNTGNIAR
jgi:hypothetical protein